MTERPWRIRLGAVAKKDFARILKYWPRIFASGGLPYKAAMLEALGKLEAISEPRGGAQRDDIGAGVRTLNVSHNGKRGPHLLIYSGKLRNRG